MFTLDRKELQLAYIVMYNLISIQQLTKITASSDTQPTPGNKLHVEETNQYVYLMRNFEALIGWLHVCFGMSAQISSS